MNNPDTGDQSLTGTVISPTPGSNCPAGGGDARCTVTVTVVGATTLTFTQTAASSSAAAGGTVAYTITIANSGASPYTGASFTDPLGGVLDDAAWDNDAAASAGTVAFASPTLSWAGNVPANGTVTITYTVTVNNPDTGNRILASTISSPSAGSNCPAASPGPQCTATVTVSQLTIVSTPSPGDGHARDGGERDHHDRQYRADPVLRDQRQLHHRQHGRPDQRRRQRDGQLRHPVGRARPGRCGPGTSRSAAR